MNSQRRRIVAEDPELPKEETRSQRLERDSSEEPPRTRKKSRGGKKRGSSSESERDVSMERDRTRSRGKSAKRIHTIKEEEEDEEDEEDNEEGTSSAQRRQQIMTRTRSRNLLTGASKVQTRSSSRARGRQEPDLLSAGRGRGKRGRKPSTGKKAGAMTDSEGYARRVTRSGRYDKYKVDVSVDKKTVEDQLKIQPSNTRSSVADALSVYQERYRDTSEKTSTAQLVLRNPEGRELKGRQRDMVLKKVGAASSSESEEEQAPKLRATRGRPPAIPEERASSSRSPTRRGGRGKSRQQRSTKQKRG